MAASLTSCSKFGRFCLVMGILRKFKTFLQLFLTHQLQKQRSTAQIVQVVVAGNSVQIQHGASKLPYLSNIHRRSLFSNLIYCNLASKDQSKLSELIKELDMFLTQIAAGIPIDIMAGYNDPANLALPQQPLNRCLFPGSSAYNTFRSCTNPHL
ncbi:DNA polymerase delta small subunit isoform X1 [Tanacetum coccineum]